MIGKKTIIDFGTVFVSGMADSQNLTHELEKAVHVNGGVILETGAYKYRTTSSDRPYRLTVTVELGEA